ncbi:MAG TPA: hypothetical protein VJS19_02310 [Candidatus Dormibacteraeota bacterium]|nr:hypothetical protein [Candidatus Dormibacteraeota bacterium]
MSNADPDDLHPTLIARLRAELDRVRPSHTMPRYATSPAPIGAWRLAPLILAIAFTGILALTAFAATGSPNPAVWTNRVETVISPPSPSPTPEDEPAASHPAATATAAPTHRPTAAPTHPAQPTSSPKHESPDPEDEHESPRPSASPSPSPPDDH